MTDKNGKQGMALPWEIDPEAERKVIKKAGMLIDLRRCVGCHACAVSCKTEHSVPLGSFRNRTHYTERPDSNTIAFMPMLCMHCEDAPCVKACPVEAITRRPDGRVVVDDNICDAHQECMRACPYDAIFLNPDSNKAEKCDFCEHRSAVGMAPACVEVCPTEALRFGDLDDEQDPLTKIFKESMPKAYKEKEGTKPRVLYLGLEAWMEEKSPGIQRGPGEDGIIYE